MEQNEQNVSHRNGIKLIDTWLNYVLSSNLKVLPVFFRMFSKNYNFSFFFLSFIEKLKIVLVFEEGWIG